MYLLTELEGRPALRLLFCHMTNSKLFMVDFEDMVMRNIKLASIVLFIPLKK